MTTILCVLAFLALSVLGLKKPVWGLATILGLLPTYLIRTEILGIPVTLLEIMVIGFLMGVLISRPEWNQLRRLGKINWAITLFLLAAVIGVAVSPEKLKALGQLKAFFIEPVLLFYTVVLVIKDTSHLKPVFQSLMVSSGLISFFGIIQYFTFLWLPIRFWGTGDEPTRIVSVFEYPNALALFLAPLFILFFVLFQKHYELFKYRWSYHTYLTLSGVALMLTFSRGAWASLVIVLALLLFKTRKKLNIVVCMMTILILAGLLMPNVRERALTGLSDNSSREHLELITIGTNKVLRSPIVGNGLVGFPLTLNESGFEGRPVSYPHNIFLNFWLEIGLLGLIAFAFITSLALHHQKGPHTVEAQAASAFLLVLMLHGLVDVPYFKNDLAILFWFAITLFYIKPPSK